MIIIGLLDSTLEEALDVRAEGTDGGNRNRELHTDGATQTHMHPFTPRIHTFVVGSVLFFSFPPLQHTLQTPPPTTAITEERLCFLNWKLLLKRERRHGSDRRGSGKGADLVMEAIEEERTRKLGEGDEIEEKSGGEK